MALAWETIEGKYWNLTLCRAKVPGGWLVAFEDSVNDGGAGGLTFYPDPDHEWDGNSLP